MSISIQRNRYVGRDYYVCLPTSYAQGNTRYPVVYVQDGDRLLPVLENLLGAGHGNDSGRLYEHIIVGVIPQNRHDEYTPWPAQAVMNGAPAFGGLGDQYLQFLATGLKPHIDANYRTQPGSADTSIIGVSLGGLISLYAIYKQDCFGCAASISGSFWYPGFVSFMQNHAPLSSTVRVLLLSGRTEGVGDPPPLRCSVNCLNRAHLILKKQLPHQDTPLIWDDGGHMDNLDLRFERALQLVLRR
ncbi:MAG: alpha/beta hydrolase-fold protein [Clostridium sp.]|nr:alpha/beta hydrolase-fold protein [Clostridium sp.]